MNENLFEAIMYELMVKIALTLSVVLVSKYDLRIFKGNRIAQLVIVPLPDVHLVAGGVNGVKSERGTNGFVSTGV